MHEDLDDGEYWMFDMDIIAIASALLGSGKHVENVISIMQLDVELLGPSSDMVQRFNVINTSNSQSSGDGIQIQLYSSDMITAGTTLFRRDIKTI